ncbi:hypothetical protein [Lentzea aerocolonigenes]|uniref:hypothetical protein n=1 Tax=Lentzea aerocolonigenes TaxID=68170 RepID=UPI000AF6DCBA|nr:hypothetical protein [Lentzea aerocolonigenes]
MRNLLIGMVAGAAAMASIAPAQAIIGQDTASVHGTPVRIDTHDLVDDGFVQVVYVRKG